VTGVWPVLFRPPGGFLNETVINVSKQAGYKIIMWSWDEDSRDWSKPGINKIVNKVLNNAHSGDIILFHDHTGGHYIMKLGKCRFHPRCITIDCCCKLNIHKEELSRMQIFTTHAMPIYTHDQATYVRQMYQWHMKMVQNHDQLRGHYLERAKQWKYPAITVLHEGEPSWSEVMNWINSKKNFATDK
jgi:hypothetical protein